ncbi:MAG TPA: aspartate kinase [Gammaproteobacteria bacterium]|nr:aspartate kinase [Gammaproteobacteria bacterium]
MALLVQKFGGTSVGSLERISAVAEKIKKTRDEGHDVVVVVSAMSGETDRLINMAKQIHLSPDSREYAALVTTGEQVTTALLAINLQKLGVSAKSYTAHQAKILTDKNHMKARILDIDTQTILKEVKNGLVVIVAGFQGVSEEGEVTTLGRGGSDTTAVALAAALKASECQIYTDVEGVYTADPRVVSKARLLTHITFEEMMEMAGLGAKVLQPRSVEFVGKYKVPLRVLSSFKEGPGTLITFESVTMEQPLVSGIAFNRNEAKLTIKGIPDEPGSVAKVLTPISDAHIEIDMIVQNVAVDGKIDFTFTCPRDEFPKALEILKETAKHMGAKEVSGDALIAKLSLIGVGMRSHAGIASKMFTVMGKEGINIQLITTSEIKISVVVDEKYLELGARALHTAFGLDVEPEEEFN